MKKIVTILPFLMMPIFTPIYVVLDNLFFVDIFGCGCVPSTQTNMLNIPFNANDLRLTVFTILTISLSLWSIALSRKFDKRLIKVLYCSTVLALNVMQTLWVIRTFMWA